MLKWFKGLFKIHPKCLGCGKRHKGAVTREKLAGVMAERMSHMIVGPGHPLYEMLRDVVENGNGQFEQDASGKIRKTTLH